MNAQTYLERFHAVAGKCGFEYLCYLQKQHLYHVPFENIDVMQKQEIVLDLHRFFAKIVERKRGGLCYELNSLFQWLLAEMGFDAKTVAATVLNDKDEWVHPDSHATTLVSIEGDDYIVDVGFGDCVREPLPLSGREVTDISGTYRIVPVNGMNLFDLQKKQNDDWRTKFRFSPDSRQLEHFTSACTYIQTSDRSPFTQGRMATIATYGGRITLSGDTLTMTQGDTRTKQSVASADIPAIFRQYFGIETAPKTITPESYTR